MAHTTSVDSSCKSAAELLRSALSELSGDCNGEWPTATKLCRLAGVSRNTLYADHKHILHELYKLQHLRRRVPSPSHQTVEGLRLENQTLVVQVSRLAALADHYFAAWTESSTLLDRRDRELADLRRWSNSEPISIKR
jgi:hypothetical protein